MWLQTRVWLCVANFSPIIAKPGATPTVPIPAPSMSPAVKKRKKTGGCSQKIRSFHSSSEGKTRMNPLPLREVMCNVFRLLAKEEPGFLERFAGTQFTEKSEGIWHKTGKSCTSGRPDLAEDYSTEIAPGWWLGTETIAEDGYTENTGFGAGGRSAKPSKVCHDRSDIDS